MAIKNAITDINTVMIKSLLDRLAQCLLSRRCLGLVFSVALTMPLSLNAIDNQKQLETVQQNIAEKEESVQQQKQQQNTLQEQLKQQENTIALASRTLHETQITLKQLNKEITNLTNSMQKLQIRQTAQQNALAKQLDAAFRQGRYKGWQLILNNEASQRRERILVWFSYLNQARHDSIEKLKQTRAELAEKKKILQEKQDQHKGLLDEQQTQKNRLELTRTERKKTLTTLEISLKKDQVTLAQLKQNETGLRDKIARAEREAEARAEREAEAHAEQEAIKLAKTETGETPDARPTVKAREKQKTRKSTPSYTPGAGERSLMNLPDGLGKPNGQAVWPVRGSVIHHFGESLQGELRWKGMVISAPEGTEVKAIADGTVLLADWLQGYGLVVVIEHGTSDMSVYGYSQNALVEVGAPVKAGQPIALVGDSGGQGYPALYLEIRRQGLAVNPQPWLGK